MPISQEQIDAERDAKKGVREGKRMGRLDRPSENAEVGEFGAKRSLRDEVRAELAEREL